MLFKAYYLKAVKILEMVGSIISILITGTTLKDVTKLKYLSKQLPKGRQMIPLPPNETVLLVKEKDTLSKILSTEMSYVQRPLYLLSGRLPAQTDSKATGANRNHTFEGPDCEGPKQLDKL